MKFSLVICILLLAATGASAQLVNGGFEQWDGSNPVGWTTPNFGPFVIVGQSNHPYSGDHAAEFTMREHVAGTAYQMTGPVSVEQGAGFELYYAQLSQGIVGTVMVLGYTQGAPVDGMAGTFGPAGDNYTRFNLDWNPMIPSFDSLQVIINIADTSDQGVLGSCLIDAVALRGITALSVDRKPVNTLSSPMLVKVYPNPFNNDATISYSAPEARVTISVVDLAGRVLGKVDVGGLGARSSVSWSTLTGNALPAGMYLIHLESAGRTATTSAVYQK